MSLLTSCGNSGGSTAAGSTAAGGSAAAGSAAGSAILTSGGAAKAGDNGSTDGKYDLVFWVYSDAVLNDQGKLFKGWADEFCKENPDVNSITFVGKDDADLLTSLMAGVGLPDMFFASARDCMKYEQAIDLLDLSSIYDDKTKSGFYANAIDAVTSENGMWAVPFMSYVPIIFRNLDVMKAAGIDASEQLDDWDTFFNECQKVKAAGYDATTSWANGGYYAPGAVLACDAKNLTVGVKDSKTTVTADQCVRTFQTIQKLESYSNGMSYSDDAAAEAFKTNKLAFLLAGPWNEPDYVQAKVNYDIQLVPPYEKGGWTGGLQGWDFMYGVNTGDAGRNSAIVRWLQKMASYDVQKKFAQVIGRSMLREDVMNDSEVMQTKMLKVLSTGLNNGMMQMEFGHSNVFWASAIGDVAPSVASGKMTPEDGAKAFVDAVNGLYAEAGE
jgi:multiple sugar transport system substrate-binding protein